MAPTFLETLRTVVGHMQVAHPEREAELARAHALILHGMVVPSPDDPETGQVLSSDGQKVYHVNGVCDCDAGQHGRSCKHVHGWRLYQYVERKLAAQAGSTDLVEPPLQNGGIGDTDSTPAPEGLQKVDSLPEAPASVNVRVTIAGREVQWTLRDSDEARLATRLEALLARYPLQQASSQNQLSPQQHNAAAMHRKVTDFCQIHSVQMKENHKDGRTWHSHYDEAAGRWCKGK